MLNVAIPTILREFHTDLPSLQWVITGYSLTFATLLIIGGRLGDMYGHRRMFMVGAAIFGVGSLLASVSHSVPTLVLGEAIIEGIGASLMIPATLSILSTTFEGPERRDRVRGVGHGRGRVGGVRSARRRVPHHASTRGAGRLRINVIVGAAVRDRRVAVHAARRATRRAGRASTCPGAAMIATGSFALVFGLSEAATYGMFRPLQDFSVNGRVLWPATRPVSIAPARDRRGAR